jgi:8-oxo-dGTP pyrophosphatase MutT (NUDIX family)
MNILAEIHRREGVNVAGRTVHRTAIRGVALRGSELLMVHSSAVGDYKFPGGGLQDGETYQQALAREIEEECGMLLSQFGQEIGAVVEYNIAVEPEYDVFKMTSHYYLCEIKEGSGAQRLDDYEARRGFQPVWIDVEEAIRLNRTLLPSPHAPEWLCREIFMLEYTLQHLPFEPVPKVVLEDSWADLHPSGRCPT